MESYHPYTKMYYFPNAARPEVFYVLCFYTKDYILYTKAWRVMYLSVCSHI